MRKNGSLFDKLATTTSRLMGKPATFLVALGLVGLWAATGPAAGFSDTWQLFVNTATTIITFLMVFLIQHTQNREAAAIRLKLDELIRAIETADNQLLGAEEMDEAELERLQSIYQNLAKRATTRLNQRFPKR